MKVDEALKELLTKVYRNTNDFEMKISKDCYKIIVNALEKRIPKKVKVEKRSKDLSILVCPICSKPSLVGMSYCRFCGQRLDWSEENA